MYFYCFSSVSLLYIFFIVIFEILTGLIYSIGQVFVYTWWLVVPLILFFVFWDLRYLFIRLRHIEGIQWVTLEVRIPREVLKTPKAMELIFAQLYGSYSNGMKFIAQYLEGKVEPWFSFEMVGGDGGVRFFIHAPSRFRNLLEAAIFAQYPDAEINEVTDYTQELPSLLPNDTYDLSGAGLSLGKESYYPIRTYQYFDDPEEERRLDTMGPLVEVMANLKTEERLWVQVLISPTGAATGNKWQEEGVSKVEEIAGRKAKAKKGPNEAAVFIKNLAFAPFQEPQWGEKKEEKAADAPRFLHSGEQDTVKAINNKISRQGFETLVRLVYIDRRDSFSPANFAATMAWFQQFNIQNMNSFKPIGTMGTSVSGWLARYLPSYKEMKEYNRKRKIYDAYRARRFGVSNKLREEKLGVLTPEELATIFHFPSSAVVTPRLPRLETKKGGPPSELPVE